MRIGRSEFVVLITFLNTQREAECGVIGVAVDVKLCFTTEDEKAVFEKSIDVLRDLVSSLR